MAPMSRGPAAGAHKRSSSKARNKPRKTGTSTQKNHRFESFSSRITRLNIDPLRRNANAKAIQTLEGEPSRFRASFLEWKDLNMSESFRNLSEELDPLCQSLPQVIHYEDQIVEILLRYLNKRDELSLEPLLSLTSHLAHDLGPRFEAHFQSIVETVCSIAATHTSIEVVEWSFTCLAFLFKFLARLLVSDLRPLFDLMAPYLGKAHQKHYVSRFTAESLSFLVRKAGARYSTNPTPLGRIVDHAFNDLQASPASQASQYAEGIAYLFADSIKGVQSGLNASGKPIVEAILSHFLRHLEENPKNHHLVASTIEAILINVMHHTDREGFAPVLDTALLAFNPHAIAFNLESAEAISRILNVIISVRKGTRVHSWVAIFSLIDTHITSYGSLVIQLPRDNLPSILRAVASLLQYMPLDIAQNAAKQLLSKIEAEPWLNFYLEFAIYFEKMGRDRFNSLIQTGFQQFVIDQWHRREQEISIVLPRLLGGAEVPSTWRMKAPSDWAVRLQQILEKSQHSTDDLERVNTYLSLMGCLSIDSTQRKLIAESLLRLAVQAAQTPAPDAASSSVVFAMGRGLGHALSYLDPADVDIPASTAFIDPPKRFYQNVSYVTAINRLLEMKADVIDDSGCRSVVTELLQNLSAPSHLLRAASLSTLRTVLQNSADAGQLKLIDLLIGIEGTPVTFDNHRFIAKDIRTLATAFRSEARSGLIAQIIPLHLLGLLHVPLAPIWDEVAEALKDIVADRNAEEALVNEALVWLEAHSAYSESSNSEATVDSALESNLSDFECSNLRKLDLNAIETANIVCSAPSTSQASYDRIVQIIPRHSERCRARILKVLNKIPQVAEKKSRLFVATFISGLRREEAQDDNDGDDDEPTFEELNVETDLPGSPTWTVQDKRSVLGLLSQFANPAVVYRTGDVYECLLQMIANGDAGIQRNALKALIAWRPAAIKKYRDNMMNLLDDARFREELSVFLGLDRNEQTIEIQHRPELIPVLLRLLYGRIIARGGNTNMRRSQAVRRKAVLNAVARLGKSELKEFVKIALHPLEALELRTQSFGDADVLSSDLISPRKQLGLLRMTQDILEIVPTHVAPFADMLMDATLYCAVRANKEEELVASKGHLTSLVKATRQESLGCLTQVFVSVESGQWGPYIPLILDRIVRPRLKNLPIETAQGISGLLRLFAAWAASAQLHPHLILDEPEILQQVSECLVVTSAKEEVKTYVLEEILQPLYTSTNALDAVTQNAECSKMLSEVVGSKIIRDVTLLITTQPEQKCLQASVRTLLQVGSLSSADNMQGTLVPALTLLLRQPSRNVALPLKADILRLLVTILPSTNLLTNPLIFSELWSTISTMFSYVNRPGDRRLLVDALEVLTGDDGALHQALDLVRKLNAFSVTRATEPDFGQRQEAMNGISDFTRPPYPAKAWEPLLHNLLYLIRDNDELAMRSGSSFSIQRFVEEATADGAPPESAELFDKILTPALQRGMSEPSELVKSEYLAILSKLASRGVPGFEDLKHLLGSDDESSFFNNILHIQQHRRARALHRLSAQSDNLTSKSISKVLMPLIEPLYKEEDANASLAIDAIKAAGSLCSGLDWQSYRSYAQSIATNKTTYQSKSSIRALGAAAQTLFSTSIQPTEPPTNLAKTLPSRPILYRWISGNLLPKILEFVHYKDESTVDLRVMVALIAVKLIMILPEDEIARLLPPVLLDMTNVLRSRSQEARDSVRKTLAEIAAFVGPEYFGFILKQLRTALQRGAHLHVLSFTVHSLVVQIHDAVEEKDKAKTKFAHGDIDYCTEDIMRIVIEDVFGSVGAEKDAEGYTSKMLEVRKKNLSNDTLEKLAKITSAEQAAPILNHIWQQLDKLRPRLEKIEELLQRLQRGWRENPDASTIKWLGFCYQVLKGAFDKVEPGQDLQSPLNVKMASFSLEVLRRTLDKHEELKSVENLTGFMAMLRTASQSRNDEVQAAAMRVLASIIKVPLKELDEQADEYVRVAKKAVEHSPSVNAPLPQAALRLLAALLRDRPNAQIKASRFESHIAYVLSRMKPDLNEPARSGERDRQVAAFNLLRAVLDRGVLIKEVYEIMDVVREVMITTTEHPIPRLSRSVYSRFVLDYFADGGKGFQKQMDFLISNLQYPAPNGRVAVMEVLIFLVNKMPAEQFHPLAVELFLPLVVIMGADESLECQDSARILLKRLLEKADIETKATFRGQMLKWIYRSDEALWHRIGLQYASIYLSVGQDARVDADDVAAQAGRVIVKGINAKKRDALAHLESALAVFKVLCSTMPEVAFRASRIEEWQVITGLVQSKSDKIKRVSAQLFETFLGHLIKSRTRTDNAASLPLVNPAGLSFDKEAASKAIEAYTNAIRTTTDPELTGMLTANLGFIARIVAESQTQDILETLLSSTASAVRMAPETSSMKPQLAALRLLHRLCESIPLAGLESSLETVLLSLNNLTDPTIPKAIATEPDEDNIPNELTNLAQESLETLRSKLGPTQFVAQLSAIQKQVKERREERRAKRRIDAVSHPDRIEKVKQRKHEASKAKRRDRNAKAAGKRRGW